ncbi:winged helix-turn-helix transcriptional regulator [Qipengyuania marisflavi]|uniref:Winged helix-turn-helix transcriptional regulator n=2 Tax=Qipengyuania marisflavi TaxID=2486356 RepID=A0A5S3P0V5_9SPHN|nr:winged helix-turn-helix transcriptional regulator [Qipengyuania marisflavi]
MPRRLHAGPVELDLFHRDGRIEQTWLGLHPREFGLLWRLAETPFDRVTRRDLLTDVWRLDHVPETNSLEVHVSRLRAKLAISGAGWLVRTHPDGGYQLGHEGGASFSVFTYAWRESLDTAEMFGNAAAPLSVLASNRHGAERPHFD